jgi:hypothetical protein
MTMYVHLSPSKSALPRCFRRRGSTFIELLAIAELLLIVVLTMYIRFVMRQASAPPSSQEAPLVAAGEEDLAISVGSKTDPIDRIPDAEELRKAEEIVIHIALDQARLKDVEAALGTLQVLQNPPKYDDSLNQIVTQLIQFPDIAGDHFNLGNDGEGGNFAIAFKLVGQIRDPLTKASTLRAIANAQADRNPSAAKKTLSEAAKAITTTPGLGRNGAIARKAKFAIVQTGDPPDEDQ